MAKRRKYPAELKAKVALEALRGEHTLAELSSKYNVHTNLIANWKRQAKENLVDMFAGGAEKRSAQHEVEIISVPGFRKLGSWTFLSSFSVPGFRKLGS